MSEQELIELRRQIDIVDGQLLDLLSQRAQVAAAVARVKGAAGNTNCYRPEREARVLRKILDSNPGPLADEEVARLFREIMSACLALEQPLTVGFLGPEGTFTQMAALKHFGHSVRTVPLASIDAVFREVEAEDCDYGVVPIENSIEGVVNHTLDSFMNSPLKICGEVEVRVHHHLLSESASLAEITRIYAHQQALAQCRRWLDGQLPHADQIALSSNAEGARRVKGEAGAAAIAGETAAEIYGLGCLARNIEDELDNTTRFLIVGRHDTPSSGDDKTSLLLAAPNRPGALYRLLEAFAEHGVSMTRIESRPSRRGTWDYVFFVDIEGHADDQPIAGALGLLRERASLLKVLGSYPRAVL